MVYNDIIKYLKLDNQNIHYENMTNIEYRLGDIIESLNMLNKLPDVILLFQNNIYRALEKIIIDVVDDFETKFLLIFIFMYKEIMKN